MLNHYSRPSRILTGLSLFIFLSCFIFIPTGCNKSSNQLKPFSASVSFSKTIDYNGSTLLLVDFEQKMVVGPDSLKITISNPSTTTIDDWEVLIYVQKADEFDQTMDYRYRITLHQLAPQEDTTLVLNNYDLPLEESEIKIGLLRKNTGTNPLSGVYDGQVAYVYGTDSVPTAYSFAKGVVYADGKFDFWMKLGSINKKLSGQFIGTLSMNSIYQPTTEPSTISGILDTISNATDTLSLRVKLQGQAAGSESKLWFNLYK